MVTVQCSRISGRKTRVEVTYLYIPLLKKGRKFIDGFTIEFFKKFIGEWRELLLRYVDSAGQPPAGADRIDRVF